MSNSFDGEDPREWDEELLIDRLSRAEDMSDVLREILIDIEVRSELERLETALMLKEQAIERGEHALEQKDEGLVTGRLSRVAEKIPDILREILLDKEFCSELERCETALMLKDQIIEQKNKTIEQRNQVIEQRNKAIEQKKQKLEASRRALEQKEQELEQKNQAIEQKNKMLAVLLHAQGPTPEAIADQLQLTEEDVVRLLK